MFADNITSSSIDKMDTPLVIVLLSASFIICSVVAFTIDPSHSPSHPLQLQKQRISIQREPNFYEVAQKMGKTVLRPGGSEATKHVQAMADIRPGDSVLELSAGLGTTGIELAQKYGAKVLITDIDTSRLDKVTDRVNNLGISNLISVKKVDMFDNSALGSEAEAKFDVAQTEASLTHYPRSRKRQFFKGIANHADKFILHEICFKTNDTASQLSAEKDMSKVLNIGFKPETTETWQQLLLDAGYTNIEHVSTGDLAVLNPISLIKDEGLFGFAKIVFNVATHPYERSRMIAVRNEISKHADDLGYITIVASK